MSKSPEKQSREERLEICIEEVDMEFLKVALSKKLSIAEERFNHWLEKLKTQDKAFEEVIETTRKGGTIDHYDEISGLKLTSIHDAGVYEELIYALFRDMGKKNDTIDDLAIRKLMKNEQFNQWIDAIIQGTIECDKKEEENRKEEERRSGYRNYSPQQIQSEAFKKNILVS